MIVSLAHIIRRRIGLGKDLRLHVRPRRAWRQEEFGWCAAGTGIAVLATNILSWLWGM
jgi:hypothetical protein